MNPRRRSSPFDWSLAIIVLLGAGSALNVYLRDGVDRVVTILGSDALLLVSILPQVLAGCLIGMFVTLLLPREVTARWVGAESGFSGLLIAAAAGVILPGGPLTVFPVAAALIAAGADAGAAIAFITSWTLLGYTRAVIWELPFFGQDFVLWRIALSLPLPILVGLLARYAARIFPGARKPAA
jgi:uncharacterized membrane protein YraQ (UPF0718 family)